MAHQYNQYNHQSSMPQQPTNPRFSWQLPIEEPTNQARSQERVLSQLDTQQAPAPRFSYMQTPTAAQQRPSVRGMPSEPAIPHSPVETSPRSPVRAHGDYSAVPHQSPTEYTRSTPVGYQPSYPPIPAALARPDEIKSPVGPGDVYPTRSPPPQTQQQQYAFESPHAIPQYAQNKHHDPNDLPHKNPTGPGAPTSPTSYTPYEPHSNIAPPKRTPTFAPDSSLGPNGLQPDLHRPGQITHPNMSSSSSPTWTHSLCSCTSDISTCTTGLLCPCILYSKTSYRLARRSERKDPTDVLGWSALNSSCAFMAAACGLWCLFPIVQRVRVRHAYKIEGSALSDALHGCCCCCCVAVQNEREVRDREDSLRRWAGPAGSGQYVPDGQMVYAPPPR